MSTRDFPNPDNEPMIECRVNVPSYGTQGGWYLGDVGRFPVSHVEKGRVFVRAPGGGRMVIHQPLVPIAEEQAMRDAGTLRTFPAAIAATARRRQEREASSAASRRRLLEGAETVHAKLDAEARERAEVAAAARKSTK